LLTSALFDWKTTTSTNTVDSLTTSTEQRTSSLTNFRKSSTHLTQHVKVLLSCVRRNTSRKSRLTPTSTRRCKATTRLATWSSASKHSSHFGKTTSLSLNPCESWREQCQRCGLVASRCLLLAVWSRLSHVLGHSGQLKQVPWSTDKHHFFFLLLAVAAARVLAVAAARSLTALLLVVKQSKLGWGFVKQSKLERWAVLHQQHTSSLVVFGCAPLALAPLKSCHDFGICSWCSGMACHSNVWCWRCHWTNKRNVFW